MRALVVLIVGLVGAGVVGCIEDVGAGPAVCSREQRRWLWGWQPEAYDLLVIVDRSPSMADEPRSLSVNAADLGGVLETTGGVSIDVHLAVVTSDLGAAGVPGCDAAGDRGRFQAAARCGVDGSYLRWTNVAIDGLHPNFGGTLSDAMACVLDLPLSSCPVSQPLAAALRALDGSNPANDGFRRPGATLLVVVITDGDDCSLVDPAALTTLGWPLGDEAAVDIACFAAGVTCTPADPRAPGAHDDCAPRADGGLADPARTLAVIAQGDRVAFSSVAAAAAVVNDADGLLAPVCPGGPSATPAPRLAALGGGRSSVCDPSWGDLLSAIASLFPVGSDPCLDRALDLEPEVPGMQVRCERRLFWPRLAGRPGAERALPWCGAADAVVGEPCLRLLQAPTVICPSGAAVDVAQGDRELAPGAVVELRCELPCR